MEGKIDNWVEEKGYGFVKGDDNQNYFLHISQLVPQDDIPDTGDRVRFDAVKTPKGWQAKNAVLIT